MKISSFRHDRSLDLSESCLLLKDAVNLFSNSLATKLLTSYFNFAYSLPREVTKRQVQIFTEGSYNYEQSRFEDNINIKSLPAYLVKFITYYLWIILNSKRTSKKVNVELLIDAIFHQGELDRFNNLILKYKKNEVGVVSHTTQIKFDDTIILNRPNYKYYLLDLSITSFLKEMLIGYPLSIILSIFTRTNYLAFSLNILNQYLYYRSLFNSVNAKNTIQEKHYRSSAIKRYLFKKMGGLQCTTFQKNIYQYGRNGFYYDYDTIFTLGKKTLLDAKKYGANVDLYHPIGSMFMEHLWFNNPQPAKDTRDILFIGINASQAMHYVNAYDNFKDDYYKSFEWLARYSRQNKKCKIGIKHHQSHSKHDNREQSLIEDSNIINEDYKLNSYQLSFSTKCIVTFGSTMGFELLPYGVPVIFIDPEKRCAFLPNGKNDFTRFVRATNYEEFSSLLDLSLSNDNKRYFDNISTDDFCLDSKKASQEIYNFFEK